MTTGQTEFLEGSPLADAGERRARAGSEAMTNAPLWSRLAALFLICLVVHLPGTWILPLVDRDETYYAEVSREMNERGDYLVPYFNGKVWLEKPPLLFWCQSASFRLFGENPFAARFPGVLATALTALVIFGFCSSLYDSRTAWRAALSFVLCLQLVIFGRAGVIDMLLVLFTTLAAWAGWELIRGSPRRVWWWTFYLALVGAALAKGPIAVIPLGTVIVFAIWARDPKVFRTLKFGRGLALAALLLALWVVPVDIVTKGEFYKEFVGDQVVAKLSTSQQGHGASNLLTYLATLPFYFVLLFPTFLPWSIYIPPTWRRMNAQRSSGDLYLASGILLAFCLFSLVRTKLPHYTLPAFPLLACAVAPAIPDRHFFRLALGMVALNFAVAFLLFPFAVQFCVSSQLAASPLVQKEMEVAVVGYSEPGLVWHLRGRVKSWHKRLKPRRVEEFMNQTGPRLCVLPSEQAAQMTIPPDWQVVTARGLNFVNGRWVELSMLVKSQ